MTVKTDFIQLGVSATAANNFILNPDGAGGLKIQRGTVVNGVPAPLVDIMTVDANGRMTLQSAPVVSTASVPSFRARKSATQSVGHAADTLLLWDVTDWNDGGGFQTNGFLPKVAGLYQFTWRTRSSPTTGAFSDYAASLRLNGVPYASGSNLLVSGVNVATSVGSAVVKLNGTTDYVDLILYQANSGGSAATVSNNSTVTAWEGCLIKAL